MESKGIRILIWGGRWKLIVDLNRFENYDVYILRPLNTESGEPELKKIW